MCLTVQPEPIAVLCVGLWLWVELNDGPYGTARASVGTMCRFITLGAAE